jgi:hypothetical protein
MSTSDEADLIGAIDDASEWGTPKRGRKSEKRQRSAVVSVRMTQDELARVQAEAQAAGQTVGTYMRDVALSCHQSSSTMVQPLFLVTGNALFADHLEPFDHKIRTWHEPLETV